MSKAVILQHVEFETPGRLAEAFRRSGIPLEIRKLYQGDEVPRPDDELKVLVIMGGSMGVGDIPGGKYPFLQAETELLQKLIAQDRPVLGICLGAQLIAHAAGAKVYPNTRPGATKDAPGEPAPEMASELNVLVASADGLSVLTTRSRAVTLAVDGRNASFVAVTLLRAMAMPTPVAPASSPTADAGGSLSP